jgi:hypothetical protein
VFLTNRFKVPRWNPPVGGQQSCIPRARQGSRFRVCSSEFRVNLLLKIKSSFKKPRPSVLSPHYFFLLSISLLFALCSPRGIRFADLPKVRFHWGAMRYAFVLVFLILWTLPLPAANAAQVTLAWDKNAEADIAGYKLYYGTSSRNYNYTEDIGNSTTYTVSELDEDRTYYFAVTALDGSGILSLHKITRPTNRLFRQALQAGIRTPDTILQLQQQTLTATCWITGLTGVTEIFRAGEALFHGPTPGLPQVHTA